MLPRLSVLAILLSSPFPTLGEPTPENPPPPFADVPFNEVSSCALVRLRPDDLFDQPVGFAHLPDGSTVIACQRGLFHRVHLDRPSIPPEIFLDLRSRMEGLDNFEEGVHGIVFHPDFKSNGRCFLSYSQNHPRRTVISEMKVDRSPGDFAAVPRTERVLLEVQQPLADHWGGQVVFGPDGFLYIGLGDGGLRDDPYRMAQNPWLLHGKILRIDVDQTQGALAYAIPKDNPFVGLQLMREEIWASGLRNPWGLAFDPETHHLWCADVGQDAWEEINLITKGGNYGWSDRDGPGPFPVHPVPLLPDAELKDPAYAYTRMRGDGICIVGGILYRGEKLPELRGSYIYGDWGYGYLEAVKISDDSTHATQRHTLYRKPADSGPFNPVFIGADTEGEPIVLSQNGTVWRLAPAD